MSSAPTIATMKAPSPWPAHGSGMNSALTQLVVPSPCPTSAAAAALLLTQPRGHKATRVGKPSSQGNVLLFDQRYPYFRVVGQFGVSVRLWQNVTCSTYHSPSSLLSLKREGPSASLPRTIARASPWPSRRI